MKPILVVKVYQDSMSVVLNAGSADGMAAGQRVQIYGEGDELFDPVTNESLGKLEIVRGTGKAVHVQERMTTVRSDAMSEAARTIRKKRPGLATWAVSSMFGPEEVEEVMPKECLPFENARQGDKARLI